MFNRFHSFMQRMVKDRDLILRSEGHVRHYTLSRSVQMWLSVPFALFFLWLFMANVSILYQDYKLTQSEEKMQLLQHEYLDLLQVLVKYQKTIGDPSENDHTKQQISSYLLKESLLTKIDDLRHNLAFWGGDTTATHQLLDRISTVLALADEEYQALYGYKTIFSEKISDLTESLANAEKTTSDIQVSLEKAHQSLSHSLQKNDALSSEIVSLESKLDKSKSETSAGIEKIHTLTSNIKKLRLSLADMMEEKNQIAEKKQISDQKLERISGALEQSQSHAAIVEQQFEIVETALHNTLKERGELISIGRQLQQEIDQKNQQIASITDFQQVITEDVLKRTEKTLALMRTPIEMAGLSPDKFLSRVLKKNSGMGGPFISALNDNDLDLSDQYQEAVHRLDARLTKLNGFETLALILPFHEPVLDYRVTSRFGRRKDPINGKWATHKGLDMVSKNNTPIYTPSPGTVVYAGRLGRFGKFIEIDHGKGIKTRYGHLNKILVKKGQRVTFRKKIALMGSSGRSTGTHLHYEIMIDNKQVNPEHFIKAGRYVFKK